MYRVLLITDDWERKKPLKSGLLEGGFTVTPVASADLFAESFLPPEKLDFAGLIEHTPLPWAERVEISALRAEVEALLPDRAEADLGKLSDHAGQEPRDEDPVAEPGRQHRSHHFMASGSRTLTCRVVVEPKVDCP